ncbi:unnamed protein product, partial [Hymenolepis diminuta]
KSKHWTTTTIIKLPLPHYLLTPRCYKHNLQNLISTFQINEPFWADWSEVPRTLDWDL